MTRTQKQTQKAVEEFLRWRAWARQLLGLTLSEFERMTPREIEIELDVAKSLMERHDRELDFLAKLIDTHFAMHDTILYNAHYKRGAKTDDFKLLSDRKRQQFSPEVMALDAKLRAEAQARLRARRAKAKEDAIK